SALLGAHRTTSYITTRGSFLKNGIYLFNNQWNQTEYLFLNLFRTGLTLDLFIQQNVAPEIISLRITKRNTLSF
ncbi:MAG TPA: hypothetical protein VLZ75_06795, partial [Chitinophagales bacterium]|nr:hypothetical protein [Chitinophagales bacterium]